MKAPWCGSWGIRTPGTVKPVRQFSKLVVSATHPNFLFVICFSVISQTRCKGTTFFETTKLNQEKNAF
jgi:hypothetical protein